MKSKEVQKLLSDLYEKCRTECEEIERRRKKRREKELRQRKEEKVEWELSEKAEQKKFFYDPDFHIEEGRDKEEEWTLFDHENGK